jgi:uncharacterized membrane protein
MQKFKSDLSGEEFAHHQKVTAGGIRPELYEKIKSENPHFNKESCLALSELNEYRNKYITSTLEKDIGRLSELEKEVVDALKDNQLISDNLDETIDEGLSFGDRVADKIAVFGGSWTFILIFLGLLFFWIAVNIYFLTRSFDPYPFILLNLILSCIAALQAPVIMMSQNRQEQKDRLRSKHDYQVNLKAELEIRMLHEKIDHLILNQQQHLFEIQQIQVEMLKEITERLAKSRT